MYAKQYFCGFKDLVRASGMGLPGLTRETMKLLITLTRLCVISVTSKPQVLKSDQSDYGLLVTPHRWQNKICKETNVLGHR
jgi:hypothetical protein